MRKIFLMAAAAATLFASCTKEENGGDLPGNGEPAKVGFSFKLPESAFTRANGDPQPASNPDEISVKRISVFIFDVNGMPATVNPYTKFDDTEVAAAFAKTSVSNNDVYTLQEDYYIETNSGKAHIYVGVNLPASLDKAYANETDLLSAKANANNEKAGAATTDATFAKAGEFTMFGQGLDPVTKLPAVDLKEWEEGTPTTLNTVTVDVQRVVSKVVGTTRQATFSATKAGSTDLAYWGLSTNPTNDMLLKYDIVGYNVYSELAESYLGYRAGRSVWDSIYDQYESFFKNSTGVAAWLGDGTHAGANKAMTVFAGSGPNAALKDLAGFYVGENYSSKNPDGAGASLNGNTTYAMVATKVKINYTAAWDATDKKVVWNQIPGSPTNYTTGTETLYVVEATVRETGKIETFISTIEADAEAIIDGLEDMRHPPVSNPDADAIPGNGDEMIEYPVYSSVSTVPYVYKESYVHFLVWLNRDGFNDYNVGRNQFIHVNVTGVTGMDGNGNNIFPGYPGEEDDPSKPIDITKNDNNPDPKIITGKIEGGKALLKVVITVKDWIYRENGGVLSK